MIRTQSNRLPTFAQALVTLLAITPCAFGQAIHNKTAVVKGAKLVVRYGDEVVHSIDDVTKASGAVLREALEGIDDISVYAKIARSRFPAEISERSLYRLQMVGPELSKIPGAADVMRLLVASNRANVKGALGELELAAFLMRRKNVVVQSMREAVETSIGKTDIDIVFTYKGVPVTLERKAIDGLALTDDLRVKIDKMADLAQTRGSVPILAAGEIPPSGTLLDYAASRGVTVTYGGYLNQCRMVQEALESAALIAK
jgi:hypothetical protein